MAYDADLPIPPRDLMEAVGEFAVAWGQMERMLLIMVKRGRGWSYQQTMRWGFQNMHLSQRLPEVKRLLAADAYTPNNAQIVRCAVSWIKKHQATRNMLVHGAFMTHRDPTKSPGFNFRWRHHEPDAARYRVLAQEARSHAAALDAAR
jgi:hypothetical protein